MRILHDFEAAQRVPISIKPQDTLEKAITLMTLHRFSQVPVMQNERQCQGYVSWQSITLSKIEYPQKKLNAKQCCRPVQILPSNTEIRDAIYHILKHDFVMVEHQGSIFGPVTLFDLSKEYNHITLPFFYIREIEADLRQIIDSFGSGKELKSRNEAKTSIDLNFSDYVDNLSQPAIKTVVQKHFDWKQVSEALETIRLLRNDVMHFKREISEEDSESLYSYAQFFQYLSSVTINNKEA